MIRAGSNAPRRARATPRAPAARRTASSVSAMRRVAGGGDGSACPETWRALFGGKGILSASRGTATGTGGRSNERGATARGGRRTGGRAAAGTLRRSPVGVLRLSSGGAGRRVGARRACTARCAPEGVGCARTAGCAPVRPLQRGRPTAFAGAERGGSGVGAGATAPAWATTVSAGAKTSTGELDTVGGSATGGAAGDGAAGDGAELTAGTGVATGAGSGETGSAERGGSSRPGSTYPFASAATRTPRWTCEASVTSSSLSPTSPTTAPSATVSPRATETEPSWSSVTA